MQRGAAVGFVASVVTGVVSLSKTLEDGRIQTVGLLLASDFIGRPERDHVRWQNLRRSRVSARSPDM